MAKFMLVLGGTDLDKRSGNPAFHGPILQRYIAWVQKLTGDGTMLGSYKLHDQIGTRLTVRGGEVVDGPFVETKEAIGGFFIIEAPSLEQATAIARGCPVFAQNGWLEVRPVER
jgi:hypothetical protein